MLEASIKTPKENLCCKQTEVRISCKGPLRAALYVFCYLENQILCFSNCTRVCLKADDVSIYYVTAPVLLTESVFMLTFHHLKNIIGNVASSYQVNLAIEIPNVTENYINSHIFTCQHWVSAMLI